MELLWLLFVSAAAPDLCPAPQAVFLSEGEGFALRRDLPVVVADDISDSERSAVATLFEVTGFRLPLVAASRHNGGGEALYVGEPTRHASFRRRRVRRLVSALADVGPEGYRLVVSRHGGAVAGSDPAGTYYGLETLRELIRAYGLALPQLEIRDEPDAPIRGVYVDAPLSADLLQELASLNCNLVIVNSDDFYHLDAAKAAKWEGLFRLARRHYIEPVPAIDPLGDAGGILQTYPLAAEGLLITDRITLGGTNGVALSKPNVIDTEAGPVRVHVSGHVCAPGVDYVLEAGELAWPFASSNRRWFLKRVPGGAIPDGATAEVTYSYAPARTSTCCPYAAETRAAMETAMRRVVDVLRPKYIHVGHGTPIRLNKDARCRSRGRTDAEVFADSVSQLDGIVKALDPDVRLMLWADAMNPSRHGERYGLAKASALLPEDVLLLVRLDMFGARGAELRETSLVWAESTGLAFCLAPSADPATVYECCTTLEGAEENAKGIVMDLAARGEASDEALRLGMNKAWSFATPIDAWPEGLNAFFDHALWRPTAEQRLAALVAFLNQRTLAGVDPRDTLAEFEKGLRDVRGKVPREDAEIEAVERLMANLVEYVKIEAAFAEKPDSVLLRRLCGLVEAQAEVSADWDASRAKRIIDTIDAKQLFVPSTILFGRHVLPYRPLDVPPGHTALEIPTSPTFEDAAHRAEALFDLGAAPGPVCRVDFEAAGIGRLTLETSSDGVDFSVADVWTSEQRGGVQGPIFPAQPFLGRYVRIRAEAPGERAVLRGPRLFALKGPAAAVCPYATRRPRLDGVLDDPPWLGETDVDGLVRTDRTSFATAPTTVRLCHTRDTLYIAVEAHEARMSALVAERTER
ncbi:MAG TPA: hypothetical protein HPP83_08700, partial [Candidatus Hydrogenedentes bacterium]|nr:hypothetical protein [Candidatus Hydrogenedentota bacterium]